MLRFIIPAYNEQDRIGPTLAALRSSFGDAEVIVIFDGDDGTPEVVRRFEGVRLLRYRSRLGKG
ncbi:MAG: glycosyltransferase, partial [Conexivisphaera sp.]